MGQGASGAGGVLGHNMLWRGGLETRDVGYKGQHQASEARRSAKQPFAPTIGFAGPFYIRSRGRQAPPRIGYKPLEPRQRIDNKPGLCRCGGRSNCSVPLLSSLCRGTVSGWRPSRIRRVRTALPDSFVSKSLECPDRFGARNDRQPGQGP